MHASQADGEISSRQKAHEPFGGGAVPVTRPATTCGTGRAAGAGLIAAGASSKYRIHDKTIKDKALPASIFERE